MTFKTRPLSLLIAAAIFLAPLNLFFKWGEAQAYVGGIFSDYLVQKMWVGEIPVILALLLWGWQKIREAKIKNTDFFKKNGLLILALIALGARQFFSPLPSVSIGYFFKGMELILFALCLIDVWPKLHQRLIQMTLLLTVLFQVVIIVSQFFLQRPLFEYTALGETQFNGSINIARTIFKTGEVILPYGTTAHPNVAAGVVVLLATLWLYLRARSHRTLGWVELFVTALVSWALFVTQSFAAIGAWVLFLIWQSWSLIQQHTKWFAFTLLLAIPTALLFIPANWQNESFDRRIFLNAHAVVVFSQEPVLGTGLGMFTTTLENISNNELVRFVQPTHNVPLLWLAETGVLGVMVLWLIVAKLSLKNNWWLLALIPILSLDHYLLTQWAGVLLLVLVVALSQEKRISQTRNH